jgi:branched-chain amino acid aminotransferase
MGNYIYLNNKVVSKEKALVSVFDRSYLYGEGVFETLRTYKGHVAFSDLHYERMKKNCKRLRIDMPLDKHAFEKAILKTLNANNLKNAYVRATISPVGASYGLERPKKVTTNFSIFCKDLRGKPSDLYNKGARVIIISSTPSDHPALANLKSTNYLNKMLARDEVIHARADEGLFCTPGGHVLEGSATNIFIVKDGEIFTPPISEGIMPGITRNIVLNLVEANGFNVYETPINVKELKSCDEVFLTGSTTEILPVGELIDLANKKPSPGPVTKKVMSTYKALLP